ncbi:hypothetical protein C8F01DRAFT_731386 [Mycena amicta]|nr:hypothetical protein C8F01DRAFT_731386 [Mycena amicta]
MHRSKRQRVHDPEEPSSPARLFPRRSMSVGQRFAPELRPLRFLLARAIQTKNCKTGSLVFGISSWSPRTYFSASIAWTIYSRVRRTTQICTKLSRSSTCWPPKTPSSSPLSSSTNEGRFYLFTWGLGRSKQGLALKFSPEKALRRKCKTASHTICSPVPSTSPR